MMEASTSGARRRDDGDAVRGTVAPTETLPAVSEAVTLTLYPPKKPKKKLKWSEDTVDNENLGRKKSKKCCIFHKKKRFDESSDESDSSDSDDDGCGHEDCGDENCLANQLKPIDLLKLKEESDRLRALR